MDMAGHPIRRRLTAEVAQTTNDLLAAGVPPRQIVTTLRQQHQDLPAIEPTVYNSRVKRLQQLLDGRSPIQAFFDELKSSQFRYTVHCNASGRIEREEEIGDYKWALKEIENLFFGQQIPPHQQPGYRYPIARKFLEILWDYHVLIRSQITSLLDYMQLLSWHLHYVAATPSSPDKSLSSGLELFQKQLDNLARSYVQWTPEQRAIMHAQIADLEAWKTPTVSNPLPVKTKGQPPGAKNKSKSSTKRDLSAFELADRQNKEKDDRKPSVTRQRKIQGQKSKLAKALEQKSSKEPTYIAKIKGQIHPFMLEYIENVTGVEPDGN
ncbi:hypothetical protein PsorP6_017244 [Peronosclerospora sorghi]|uniref:Uncharacterized protein n=1 Tax=Peronosclerospora sorghi TaxID=230839 RepID=A0ACC0WMM5_9STRA|nr:hypothetical protein PsorP6_017244 [Peronosclerospora sorghi]